LPVLLAGGRATAILTILTGLAIPLVRVTIKRQREHYLRQDLWEIRDAIDLYKDAADRGAFQIKAGSEGYPPGLDTTEPAKIAWKSGASAPRYI
jgi:type II secretory pathway pseudopilin PulG